MDQPTQKPELPELKKVYELALDGATDQELADYLRVEISLATEFYAAEIAQARAERHVKLRKKQTEVALEGSVSLLIHLGKYELGQKDSSNDHSGPRWPEPQLDPSVVRIAQK